MSTAILGDRSTQDTQTRKRGGFTMPRNPGLALQEAIEQERRAGSPPESVPEESEIAANATVVPLVDDTMPPATDALPQVRNSASAEASNSANTQAIEGLRQEAIAPVIDSEKSIAPFVATVRGALAARRNHVGGVKTSVDMSPELSLRLKRYLLDHGNPAARILMIELVTAFLTEEGY